MIYHIFVDEIEIIYKACIIEACNNRVSLWCTPFDRDIIKVCILGIPFKNCVMYLH